MKVHLGLFVAVFVLVGAGCNQGQYTATIPVNSSDSNSVVTENVETMPTYEFPGTLPDEQIQGKQIRIKTEKGDIVFELFADTAPMTVSNFVYLAQEGYYDGLTFHRREENFVIQGGDPNGNGTGGPGYRFEDEVNDDYKYDRGIVAMANAGPNTNGSQFFIMLADRELPKAYSIFGRVTQGLDVVDAIRVGDTMTSVIVEEKSSEQTLEAAQDPASAQEESSDDSAE